MNIVKKTAVRTQNFVANHKVAIAVTATAAVTIGAAASVVRNIVTQRDEFLAENGLLEKFYETLVTETDL